MWHRLHARANLRSGRAPNPVTPPSRLPSRPPERIGEIVGLKNRKCVPCEGGKVQALTEPQANRLLKQVCVGGGGGGQGARQGVGRVKVVSRRLEASALAPHPPRSPPPPPHSAWAGRSARMRRAHSASPATGKCAASPQASSSSSGERARAAAAAAAAARTRNAAGAAGVRLGMHTCPRARPPLPCRLAEIAEAEGHHPDLHLTGYNTAVAELTTHAVGGLTENDFIVAAKVCVFVGGGGGSA